MHATQNCYICHAILGQHDKYTSNETANEQFYALRPTLEITPLRHSMPRGLIRHLNIKRGI